MARAMLLSLYGFWAGHVAAITGSNAPQQNTYDVVLSFNMVLVAVPTLVSESNKLRQLWSDTGAQKGRHHLFGHMLSLNS